MKRQRKTSSRAIQAMEESPESDMAFQQQLPVQQPLAPPVAPPKKKSKASQNSSAHLAQQQQQQQQQQVSDDATLEERIRQNQEHLRAVEKQAGRQTPGINAKTYGTSFHTVHAYNPCYRLLPPVFAVIAL
eukprot:854182-Pelagomonas_calceolata.AAC.1